ncbi:MAG: DUF4054 domain-containing protein [Oscillospiraceae bacterium]|nr:DUF4054 domain-containing protein [Oscillospiraceae bacterium]
MMQIELDLTQFMQWFPALGEVTQEELNAAYAGAQSYISTYVGEIELPENLQIRGVYLASAHQLYLIQNPSIVAQGKVASASEGSVSASFTQPQFKNWFDYWLSLSPYGLELLAILSQVQPPMPKRPVGSYPYYNAGYRVKG